MTASQAVPCIVLVCHRRGRRPALGGGALCHRHALYRDRKHLAAWFRWVRQGRPRDVPVVFQQGQILRDPSGHQTVTNWGWDFNFMEPGHTIHLDVYVPYLALRYPHTVQLVGAAQDGGQADG